jgi:hypothetical protein
VKDRQSSGPRCLLNSARRIADGRLTAFPRLRPDHCRERQLSDRWTRLRPHRSLASVISAGVAADGEAERGLLYDMSSDGLRHPPATGGDSGGPARALCVGP